MAYLQLPQRNNNAALYWSSFSLPVSFPGGFLSRQHDGFDLVSCWISLNQSPTAQQFPITPAAQFGAIDGCKTFFFHGRGSLKGNLLSAFFFFLLTTLVKRCSRTACCFILNVYSYLNVSVKTETCLFFFCCYTQTFFLLSLGMVPRFKLWGLLKLSWCLSSLRSWE